MEKTNSLESLERTLTILSHIEIASNCQRETLNFIKSGDWKDAATLISVAIAQLAEAHKTLLVRG